MIVDAVMACLGYRTSSDTIRSGEDRAVLELLISPPKHVALKLNDSSANESEFAIQRDILPQRSYMRINGRIATMSMAQSIGSGLVDIHGQQEHHSLLRPQNNLAMLDEMNKDEIIDIKREYQLAYEKRHQILLQAEELNRDASQRKREIDLLSYQVDEIERANFEPGEEEMLRQEHRLLVSQRKLIEFAQEAYERLYEGSRGMLSAYDQITQGISVLRNIADIDPAADQTSESLEQVLYSLEVCVDFLRDYQKTLSLEPARLRQVEDRLDLLERLKAKYGSTIEEILEYRKVSESRLSRLVNADEILAGLKEELAQIESQIRDRGVRLSAKRHKIGLEMGKRVSSVLEELGMPGARFMVSLEQQEDDDGVLVEGRKIRAFEDGFDRAMFLFSANPGEPPLPLHKVASGGELSRLMLAIKTCIEEVDSVPTLIFDEIDAGVGGKAGQAIGEKLWRLSRSHQVLCVTHLASIAAMADTHFAVTKHEKGGRTYAQVSRVGDEDRAREIARMLSGTDFGVSLDHGRELISAAKEYKESFE